MQKALGRFEEIPALVLPYADIAQYNAPRDALIEIVALSRHCLGTASPDCPNEDRGNVARVLHHGKRVAQGSRCTASLATPEFIRYICRSN